MSLVLSQVLLVCIFISFLIVLFLYKRGPNTIKEYALGNGNFGTFALMCTVVSISFGGGSLIGAPAALYQNGAWLFLAYCAIPIGSCIMSLAIIPRLSKYYGCLSIAEVIGRMYGAYARRLVGIFAFIYCIGILGAQIKALHWIMEHIFAQNAFIATMIGVLIVMYMNFGGVSSVIKTDIIHFFVLIVIMPLVASYIIQMSGGIATITDYFHKSGRTFFHGGSATAFMSLILLCLIPTTIPDLFHRFLVGRDYKKNQAASYALAFTSLVNIVFVGCIAFIALAKFPSLEPQNVVFVVVQNFITTKWGLMLFVIALVSMIMSTAKSLINTGVVLLVNDIVNKKISENQKMKLLKVATVLSGMIALSFTYLFSNVLDIVLFFSEYYSVIVLVPLISGLFVKETRREHFWASASVGLIMFSTLHLVYRNLSHEIFLMSSIASLSAYLAVAFIFNKGKTIASTFSFHKLCDEVVSRHAIQTSNLSWIILLFFLLSMFFIGISGERNIVVMTIEGVTGALGFLLFCVDKFSIRYRSVVILSALWYCFAFSPIYVFLHQKVGSLFTINFIVSIVLLAGLFSWDVFLTLLLSGSSIAVITFGIFSHGFQGSIATVMYLFLFIGYMALVAYIAFRKKEQVIMESVKNKLEAEKSVEQGIKETHMYNKIIQAINISLDADNKYKNVLLNEDTTIEVSFKDLKDDILAYFQKVSIERKTKLIVAGSRHKVLNTGFPTGFFYKVIYSLLLNVFYCNDTEDIRLRFACDKSGKVQRIEISHGQYKINDRAKYFRGSYPKDILEWDIIKSFFERFEIKVREGVKTLKIIFPSEDVTIDSKVISFKTLRSRADQDLVS
jgi:SSS family solute:Na+ symporter